MNFICIKDAYFMTHNSPASMLGKHKRLESQDASWVTSSMMSHDQGCVIRTDSETPLVPSASQRRKTNDKEYAGSIKKTDLCDRSIKSNTENEPEIPFDGTDENMEGVSATYSTNDNKSGILEEILSMEPLEFYNSLFILPKFKNRETNKMKK